MAERERFKEMISGKGKPEELPFADGDPEDLVPLAPVAQEDLGRCAAMAKDRWVTALTIKHGAKPWESYQYRGICTRSEYTPTRFVVRFADEDATWEVVVTGRCLERLYTLVIQHRIDWIKASERGDFAESGEPIILSAEAKKVEEPKGGK